MDEKPDPQPSLPTNEQLDYALLRTSKAPAGKARHWLEPIEASPQPDGNFAHLWEQAEIDKEILIGVPGNPPPRRPKRPKAKH
jgi:hypothetical protein